MCQDDLQPVTASIRGKPLRFVHPAETPQMLYRHRRALNLQRILLSRSLETCQSRMSPVQQPTGWVQHGRLMATGTAEGVSSQTLKSASDAYFHACVSIASCMESRRECTSSLVAAFVAMSAFASSIILDVILRMNFPNQIPPSDCRL